jgi:hypothetical protein
MARRAVGGDAVAEHDGMITVVVGRDHGGKATDIGCNAGDEQVVYAGPPENAVQVRGVERTLARLVEHKLARERRQFIDDGVPFLAAVDRQIDRMVGDQIAKTFADVAQSVASPSTPSTSSPPARMAARPSAGNSQISRVMARPPVCTRIMAGWRSRMDHSR